MKDSMLVNMQVIMLEEINMIGQLLDLYMTADNIPFNIQGKQLDHNMNHNMQDPNIRFNIRDNMQVQGYISIPEIQLQQLMIPIQRPCGCG